MPKVRATDRAGVEHAIEASNGHPLMQALRDGGAGVLGTCGGVCSCGTCHVYVDPAWADKLPPKGEDETMMLDAIGEVGELKPGSRLSCQIPMSDELDGIVVTVAPEL
jgi:2Fe-2S ferredoxin